MATWFLGKIRFTKEIDAGKFQTVTEAYLLDAVSFTDAEARLYDLLGDNAPDFRVTSLSPMKVQEVFHVEGPELKWFKVKILITTFDEKAKKEKKSSASFLINADSIKQAYDRVEDALGRVEDYEITDVSLTPILEVVPYDVDNQKMDQLRPLSEAVAAFENDSNPTSKDSPEQPFERVEPAAE
ncbi:DUF4494 domain-containing protein [Siphonobacter sp.]|uniref:DUF4494 domain-containing protein n=1 Tax=Siphonobacter sp. TaxID=1869184 RepID=UPI003B3A8179